MTPDEFITKNYDNIKGWLSGITKNTKRHLFEDFVHEVIIIFLQHDKAQQAIDTGTARFFISRIALNQFRSSTSTFHYQYRDSFKDFPDGWEDNLEVFDSYDMLQDSMIEVILSSLDEMYIGSKSDRYEAIIIIIYHTMGNNYSAVGRHLNMQRATIRKIYLRGIEKIKAIIKRRIDDGTFTIDNHISGDWSLDSSSDKQQAISLAAQLFKTRYFDTV